MIKCDEYGLISYTYIQKFEVSKFFKMLLKVSCLPRVISTIHPRMLIYIYIYIYIYTICILLPLP